MKRAHIGFITLVLMLPGLVSAADISALVPECESCHGPNGVSGHSDVPSIGGQSREYISKSLRSFQRWDRPCIKSLYRYGDTGRPKTDMCKIVEGLGYEEIDSLSEHYSQQTWVAVKQDFNAERAAAGAEIHANHCENCHADGGRTADAGPVLAGQWAPYLKSALKFVPTGEHLVPPMMERNLNNISSEDIDKLMDFYASQQD